MVPGFETMEEAARKQMEEGLQVINIAKICHEANKAYCETLADFTQQEWDFAPQWQKDSAVLGVEFNLANPDAPASASHDSWLAQKEVEGWKHGLVKNADLKEHPCFLPYAKLPKNQQAKDALFKGIVCALAPYLNKTEKSNG